LLARAERIAVLADRSTRGQLKTTQATAKRLGVALTIHEFTRTPYDYEGALCRVRGGQSQDPPAAGITLLQPIRLRTDKVIE
jgi:hypothetical protein